VPTLLNYVFVGLGGAAAACKPCGGDAAAALGGDAALIGFYLALGTFMEGFLEVITTLPVVYPVMLGLGTTRSGSAWSSRCWWRSR